MSNTFGKDYKIKFEYKEIEYMLKFTHFFKGDGFYIKIGKKPPKTKNKISNYRYGDYMMITEHRYKHYLQDYNSNLFDIGEDLARVIIDKVSEALGYESNNGNGKFKSFDQGEEEKEEGKNGKN